MDKRYRFYCPECGATRRVSNKNNIDTICASCVEEKYEEKRALMKSGVIPREIDWDAFEGMCRLHCTHQEIADCLSVELGTLQKRVLVKYGKPISSVYEQFASTGKMSLRRAQLKAAHEGNSTLLVWMGKQLLAQSDKLLDQKEQQKIVAEIYEKCAELTYENKQLRERIAELER